VYLRQCDYEQAESYARLALSGFEAQQALVRMVAHAHNLLGLIAQRRGQYENCVREYYQARDLFSQARQPIDLARTSMNLCESLSRLGRVEEVLELSEQAAAIFTEYDLHLMSAYLNVQLGFFHYSRDDLIQAEAAFRRAYSPAIRRAGPIYLRSLIEMNLGNVLLLQSKPEESRVYFSSAVTGFRLVNAQTMLANSLDGLAETTLAAGDRREAVALYEEALAIVIAIPEDAFARRMERRFRSLLEELESPREAA
jgi:tetratricopeptide (TPR) repeat protein